MIQGNSSPLRSEAYPYKHVDRGRGYKRSDPKHVEVYDIDLSAWLHMHGVVITDAYKVRRESIITFYDPDTENKIDSLVVNWLNSESARFASAVRQIKKVCLSTERQK